MFVLGRHQRKHTECQTISTDGNCCRFTSLLAPRAIPYNDDSRILKMEESSIQYCEKETLTKKENNKTNSAKHRISIIATYCILARKGFENELV